MPDRTGKERPRIAGALLGWFDQRTRDIPGRGTDDPYAVWVAEVMAQQTRIVTMRAYYQRFMERWPDVTSLAEATSDEVLKAWEGLGYYSRARNLHAAAREVVERYGGLIPDRATELRRLPGIGRYTAGAIASIAFGRPEPAVDGNARRVLCRLFDEAAPTPGGLEVLARSIIASRPDRAGAINQALMDLGGQVCLPRVPKCGTCPLSDMCRARMAGTVNDRPPRTTRSPRPHRDLAVAVVESTGRFLVRRRPDGGLLGGLWEFPTFPLGESSSAASVIAKGLRAELQIAARIGEPLVTVDHAFTHLTVTMYAIRATAAGTPQPVCPDDGRAAWVLPDELDDLALSVANRRIMAAL